MERDLSLNLLCWKTKEILEEHKYNKETYEFDLFGEFWGYNGKELWVFEVKTWRSKYEGKKKSKKQLRRIVNEYVKNEYFRNGSEYKVIRTFYAHPEARRNKRILGLPLEEILLNQKVISKDRKFSKLKYLNKT